MNKPLNFLVYFQFYMPYNCKAWFICTLKILRCCCVFHSRFLVLAGEFWTNSLKKIKFFARELDYTGFWPQSEALVASVFGFFSFLFVVLQPSKYTTMKIACNCGMIYVSAKEIALSYVTLIKKYLVLFVDHNMFPNDLIAIVYKQAFWSKTIGPWQWRHTVK